MDIQKDEILESWLPEIWKMFLKYGLKSTTMYEISKNLKISKKTLYLHFANKEELVEKVMFWVISPEKEIKEMEEYVAGNPIKSFNYVKHRLFRNLSDFHIQTIFFDLKKYHIDVYEKINSYVIRNFTNYISKTIESGIEKGYFKKDTDVRIQVWVLSFIVSSIQDPENYCKINVSLKKIISVIIDNVIMNISTPVGIEEFEKINKQME